MTQASAAVPNDAATLQTMMMAMMMEKLMRDGKSKKKRDDALNRSIQGTKVEKPLTPPKNGVSDKKKLLDEAKRMQARRKMSRYDRGTKQ